MAPMRRALLGPAAALLIAACGALSCATTGGTPSPPSQPAARLGLRPEYRLFYDALIDYGDWVLIEPYGYLFRPRVDPVSWEPYEDGFWAPTDVFDGGWVWISGEPFGWATYHYGRWFYDEFQGWVWQPGLDWGPAWVAWLMNDQYVGWAPMGAGARTPASSNARDPYLFAPVDRLGSTDLSAHVRHRADLGAEVADVRPVENFAERAGVRIPLGPPIAHVERALGHALPRVKVEDLVPETAVAPGPQRGGVGRGASLPASGSVEETRRAAEAAARAARELASRGAPLPGRVPIVRPIGVPAAPTARPVGRVRRGAARDSAGISPR